MDNKRVKKDKERLAEILRQNLLRRKQKTNQSINQENEANE